MQEAMQDFRDDDGNLLNVAPDTIVIPNSAPLKRAVLAAIGSELDPNSANHASNFQVGLWRVLIWNYLPKTVGDKPYFLMLDSKFNSDYMCLPWLDRLPLTVRSDIDPRHRRQHLARQGALWRGLQQLESHRHLRRGRFVRKRSGAGRQRRLSHGVSLTGRGGGDPSPF